MDDAVRRRWMPGKSSVPLDEYRAAWREAVRVFGHNQVSTYLLVGLGEDPDEMVEAAQELVDMGVYPFVVPLRPVPGTLMADTPPPDPDEVASVYREVSAMLAEHGLDHLEAAAGCARCQACSGLSAWERLFEKEERRADRELAGR